MFRLLRAAACLLVIVGAGVLLYSGYRAWDPFAGARQQAAQQHLMHSWGAAKKSAQHASCAETDNHPRFSRPFAIIRIPAFGPSWRFTIVQGTGLAQLATGPGHITGTALPGRAGNTGIAAHDITAGNPFLHLVNLRPGNKIIITTENCVVTYRVTRSPRKVLNTDVAVLRPTGREHTITLITCWPVTLYFVPHRIVVPGVEVSSVPR